MAVYVDDLYRYPMGRFRRMKMSHMVADDDDELHAMADKIGVSRRWYQGNHYDVSMSKRRLAVKLGAKEVTIRELGAILRRRRNADRRRQT